MRRVRRHDVCATRHQIHSEIAYPILGFSFASVCLLHHRHGPVALANVSDRSDSQYQTILISLEFLKVSAGD